MYNTSRDTTNNKIPPDPTGTIDLNYKSKPDKKPRKSRKIDGLNIRERKFIKEYVKNGNNGKLAIQKSYPNIKPANQHSYASQLLSKEKIRNKLQEALERAGLTDDYIADTIKRNIPTEAIGKGANATTINKSLELLIKLKEKVTENKTSNINISMLQGINNISNSELLDKRSKIQAYFTRITKD